MCGYTRQAYAELASRHKGWRFARAIAVLVCLSLFTVQVHAQNSADTNELFRQATEAMKQGRLEDAARGFTAVATKAPEFAEAHLNLGLVLEEQGKNEASVLSFARALKLKPRLRGANLFFGIAQYRLNRFDEAIGAFKREATNYPNDPNAWMWIGVAELAREQPESAVEPLDKAAKLDPNNVDILYHRGRAHLLVSKNSYDRMLKADPDSWRVHQVLAQAYSESERHEQAVAEYQLAIAKAPDQPALHEELGSEFLETGKSEAAQAEFERELQLDPNNAFAHLKLGIIAIDRQDAAKARQAIQSALHINPNLRDADYYLGRTEMLDGKHEAAVAPFKRAIAGNSDPDVVEQAWYQLGIVYRRLGRTEEARQAVATFQRLKDESGERQQKLFERKREAQKKADSQVEEANPPK